ncbi:TPA: transposase [Pseudomonas aeruginosa]|nr:transposase [Pseudomonas aeruginosa]
MKRAKNPTFVVELPVSVSQEAERQLMARLLAGTRLYNAALGESLRRLDLMRESKAWQAARKLEAKDRTETFRAITKEFGFTSASVSAFATGCKNAAGWKNRLSANETQRIAETAFAAAEQYSFGKRGRPRFKNARRPLKSFSGKTNKTGIRYRHDLGIVEWAGLALSVKYPPIGKDKWLEEALKAETKFCRLLWRTVKDKRRWYAQLLQTGLSPIKEKNTTQAGREVGLDVGPSTVAVVSDTGGDLVAFCPTIEQPWKETRRIQRAMDRSRRATNPHCYNENGTWKKGAKVKVVSKNYLDLKRELAETERRLAAERKRSQGELVNSVIRLGNVIKTEKLSYKAWQKLYGKSVKVKAPGMFITGLKRKAESAGGQFLELNTWSLKMSQYDHVSGEYNKKTLRERWHFLGGKTAEETLLVQRDMYSAFLALCVVENKHQSSQLRERWSVVKQLLGQAGWCRKPEVASGGTIVLPTVIPSELLACQSGGGSATARML